MIKYYMKRAVLYARYSSEKQTEQSIEGQVKICREYAERQGIAIVGEYIDRAMTGTNTNRPEFQKMIADAKLKDKAFDIILVYKLDRFSRDKYESVVYKKELKNNGVAVVSATEMISNSPEGILLESVIEGYNQFYSAELSQKIKRGNRMSIEKGFWTGGNILFGYKVVDRKVVFHDDRADIMRKIFTDYANGKSKQKICDELNAKGLRTLGGKPWETKNIQESLSNKKYIGIVERYGETYTNIFPPLIDEKTFNEVQVMLNKKKRLTAKGKAKVEYLLTGKIFCLHCGSTMYGISGTARNGEKKTYYACKNRYTYKTCKKRNEYKPELEKAVVEDTVVFISQRENLERASQMLCDFHAKTATTQKITELEKRIASIDREIEKLIDTLLLAQGETMVKKINQRSKDLEIQRSDLTVELNKLKFIQSVPKSKDDYIKRLQKFVDGDINDIDYQRRIIHGLVNSVWVGDGGVFAFYNDDPTNKPLTLDEVKDSLHEQGVDYSAMINGSNMTSVGWR